MNGAYEAPTLHCESYQVDTLITASGQFGHKSNNHKEFQNCWNSKANESILSNCYQPGPCG